MNDKKYFGEAALKESPQRKLSLVIKDGSVTTKKLADGSIDGSKLTGNSVDNNHIVDGAVTSEKIDDNSILTNHIVKEAVTIEKLAEEVWNKLRAEYLRVDGTTKMLGDLNLNGYPAKGASYVSTKEARGVSSLPQTMFFQKGDYDILFAKYETMSDAEPLLDMYGGFKGSNFNVVGTMLASGFYTSDRTSLGLLNNNAEVVYAMTESDVDDCITTVFA